MEKYQEWARTEKNRGECKEELEASYTGVHSVRYGFRNTVTGNRSYMIGAGFIPPPHSMSILPIPTPQSHPQGQNRSFRGKLDAIQIRIMLIKAH